MERLAVADWIGERPDSIMAIHALRSGSGRVWISGRPEAPLAAIVESPIVPGEPQGFGDPGALLALIERVDGWSCLEVTDVVAAEIAGAFAHRWGHCRRVVDVVHVLHDAPPSTSHPLVRRIAPSDLAVLRPGSMPLLPPRNIAEAAAAAGRLFGAVTTGGLVGHAGSFAAGGVFADVGVQVVEAYRRQGIAIAAAAMTCRALQADGLVPVWGAGSHNDASLRLAEQLGFREVSRLTYLVPAGR